jgi:hypothetical protein
MNLAFRHGGGREKRNGQFAHFLFVVSESTWLIWQG